MANRQRRQQGKSNKSLLLDLSSKPQSKQPQPQNSPQHYSRRRWSMSIFILLVILALCWITISALNVSSVISNTLYAFFTAFGIIMLWLQITSPFSPPELINSSGIKKLTGLFLIHLWGKRKVRAGLIIVALLLILIPSGVFSFARCSSVTSSTPQKTLALYCSAIKQQDYETAYDLYSNTSSIRQSYTKSAWVASMAEADYSDCTVGKTSDDGVLGTGTIVYEGYGFEVTITYRLKNDCGGWKIFKEYSPCAC